LLLMPLIKSSERLLCDTPSPPWAIIHLPDMCETRG
jgi:hypothetical protein